MITALIVAVSAGGLIAGGVVTMLAERIARSEALSFRFRCGSCKARLA